MKRKSSVVGLVGYWVIWSLVIGYRLPVIGEEEVPSLALNRSGSGLGNLGTIVVTATRLPEPLGDLPTNVSVVTKEEIIRTNARNAGEAIRNTLGVIEVSERGTLGAMSDVRLRSGGDSTNRVLVMIDGRSVNDISLGSANLTQIPVDNIDRIEIIRGPASALYGANALNGVINVVTKNPIEKRPVTGIHVSGGSFNTQIYRMNFAVKGDKMDGLFTASKNSCDGWRENSDYDSSNFTLKLGYDADKIGKINFDGGCYTGDLGVPGKGASLEQYDGEIEKKAQDPDARQRDERGYTQLVYQNKIGKESNVKVRVYGDNNQKAYKSPKNDTDDISETTTMGTEFQVNTFYGIIVGGDVYQGKFKRIDESTTPAKVDIDKKTLTKAVFVQKSLTLRPITIVGGIRYDHHSVYGGQASPRLSLLYELRDDLKFSVNGGRAFRAPTFEDLYSPYSSWKAWPEYGIPGGDSMGNPNLKPETGWAFDFGVEHGLSNILLSRATLFRSDIQNFLQWANISSDPEWEQWRPSNVGKIYSQGIELELIHRIIKGLSQSINYTYLESRGKIKDQNYNAYLKSIGKKGGEDFETLMYTPEHQVNYELNYASDFGLGIKINAKYVDERWNNNGWDFDGVVEKKLPGYGLLDVRVSQKILSAELFISIENVLDKKYQSRDGYPLPGRIISAGIRMKLLD